MPQELNQAMWRVDRNVRDGWGRLWLISFETGPGQQGGSGMPTGQITPAGWSDPLATPQQYFRIPVGEFGEPDRNKLLCDLAPWLKSQRAAEVEWKKELYRKGQQHYKSAFNPKLAEEDDFLMSVQGVGPKPWPPSAAIQRAIAGDRAMLGLAPLSKADRVLLGRETEEDLGFASAPSVAEENPALPPAPRVRARKPLTYWAFVRKLKASGVSDAAEIKAHYEVYKAEQRQMVAG